MKSNLVTVRPAIAAAFFLQWLITFGLGMGYAYAQAPSLNPLEPIVSIDLVAGQSHKVEIINFTTGSFADTLQGALGTGPDTTTQAQIQLLAPNHWRITQTIQSLGSGGSTNVGLGLPSVVTTATMTAKESATVAAGTIAEADFDLGASGVEFGCVLLSAFNNIGGLGNCLGVVGTSGTWNFSHAVTSGVATRSAVGCGSGQLASCNATLITDIVATPSQCLDPPSVNVLLRGQSLSFQPDQIYATFTPTRGGPQHQLPRKTAAMECFGFKDFDWQQTITTLPGPSAKFAVNDSLLPSQTNVNGFNGSVQAGTRSAAPPSGAPPFPDPPNGGYSDAGGYNPYPFYFPPDTLPTGEFFNILEVDPTYTTAFGDFPKNLCLKVDAPFSFILDAALTQIAHFPVTLSAVQNSDKLWDPLESTCRHASLSIL